MREEVSALKLLLLLKDNFLKSVKFEEIVVHPLPSNSLSHTHKAKKKRKSQTRVIYFSFLYHEFRQKKCGK